MRCKAKRYTQSTARIRCITFRAHSLLMCHAIPISVHKRLEIESDINRENAMPAGLTDYRMAKLLISDMLRARGTFTKL